MMLLSEQVHGRTQREPHLGQAVEQVGVVQDGGLLLLHAAGRPCAAEHLDSHGSLPPLGQVHPAEGALPNLLLDLQIFPGDLKEEKPHVKCRPSMCLGCKLGAASDWGSAQILLPDWQAGSF